MFWFWSYFFVSHLHCVLVRQIEFLPLEAIFCKLSLNSHWFVNNARVVNGTKQNKVWCDGFNAMLLTVNEICCFNPHTQLNRQNMTECNGTFIQRWPPHMEPKPKNCKVLFEFCCPYSCCYSSPKSVSPMCLNILRTSQSVDRRHQNQPLFANILAAYS